MALAFHAGGGGGGGGAGTFSAATVTLTDAQLKALPTTPVQLVAAPGSGKVLVPILVWMHLAWVADYTNIGSLAGVTLEYGATNVSPVASMLEAVNGQISGLLADGASHAAYMPMLPAILAASNLVSGVGQFQDDPDPINAALSLTAQNAGTHTGNFTGGDVGNSLKVTVYYATAAN